jgi:hypothetical protein
MILMNREPRKSISMVGANGQNRYSRKTGVLTDRKDKRKMAERVGFEPTVGVSLHTLSKRAP